MALALGSLKVAGNLEPYEWVIHGLVKSITVNGAITSDATRAPNCWIYGAITSLKAGACRNVCWLVGTVESMEYPDGGYVANSASNYNLALPGSIGALTITGIKGDAQQSLQGSGFSARTFGTVSIASVNPPSGWPTGIYTTSLKKLTFKNLTLRKVYRWPFGAGTPTELTDLVQII
jgi:hypothetical protein